MINLSMQNFIPFLVAYLFPTGLRIIKEKGGLKPSRTLQKSPRYKKPFHFPVFSFVGKGFSLLGLSSKEQIQAVTN